MGFNSLTYLAIIQLSENAVLTLATIIVGLVGTFATVGYKYRKKPKKDRLDIFLERYDIDVKNLSDRLKKTEKKLDDAIATLEAKDEQINALSKQLSVETDKYSKLLRKFNSLKLKFEKESRRTRVIENRKEE